MNRSIVVVMRACRVPMTTQRIGASNRLPQCSFEFESVPFIFFSFHPTIFVFSLQPIV